MNYLNGKGDKLSKTILWIDDDGDLLESQKKNLTERGYKVVIESDVDKAIDYINNNSTNLIGIIFDVMMNPGITLKDYETQGGLRTGIVLIDYLHERKLIDGVRCFVFTHRIDPVAVKHLGDIGISYKQKQKNKGKKIITLVEELFEVSHGAA